MGHRPKTVTVDRDEQNGFCIIDASHDGYVPVNGITHRRRFYLADNGHDLRGEDNLSSSIDITAAHDLAMRFHLHPNVMVSLVQGGQEALLRLSNGTGWRFTITGGELELENSVYLGEGVRPRKTKQLVIKGQIDSNYQQFKWALQRESK